MIHEYTIAPELLMKWAADDRDYDEFFEKFGLGHPRVVSSFPKKKATKFRSYFLRNGPADRGSQQGMRYVEMVTHMIESLVLRDDFFCNSTDWENDVITEDKRAPFYAVLSTKELNTPRSLTPDNMYLPNSIWKHKRQANISRTYESMSVYLKNILRISTKKVVIIDSFGWNARAIDVVCRMIDDILIDRIHSDIPEVTLYYKERLDKNPSKASPAADSVEKKIQEGLSSDENLINIKVVELKERTGEDVFHNRCILTEHGGVKLGHGIDLSKDPNHTDEIDLMEKHIYMKYWDQFVENLAFEVITES